MKILYNFASRERPERFFETLQNIHNLSISPNYSILCKLDYDDKVMQDQEVVKRLYAYSKIITIEWGGSDSKVHAINRGINKDKPWDIMVVMSDDMKFTAYGFDEIIRDNMPVDLDAFLHFPDDYADGQAMRQGKPATCTMSIIGRKYYERFGYVYHPDYYSLWCDDEATAVAKILGKYRRIEVNILEHLHYSAGKATKDALYWRNDTYNRDREVYQARAAKNFDL